MRPADRDHGRAGSKERSAAPVRSPAHQGITGQPHHLSRDRHMGEHIPSPPGRRERVQVSQAQHGSGPGTGNSTRTASAAFGRPCHSRRFEIADAVIPAASLAG